MRGRGIAEQDTATSRHVAVVNEAFARKFFKGEDPLGKHFGQHDVGSEREYEVVGVSKDAHYFDFDLDKPIGPFFVLPEAQHDASPKAPSTDANPGSHFLHDVVIATRPGAHLSAATVRQAIASIDPGLPVSLIRPLKEQVSDAFLQQRLMARLASFFGVLSLLLASIGLYGVTAHNAGSRTGEIGVRIALGASRGQVIRLVLRGAFALTVVGLLCGLPLTFAVGRFLGAQLYGASPFDPAVILAAVCALGVSALVASLVPAVRASLISPVDALRSEQQRYPPKALGLPTIDGLGVARRASAGNRAAGSAGFERRRRSPRGTAEQARCDGRQSETCADGGGGFERELPAVGSVNPSSSFRTPFGLDERAIRLPLRR